MTKWTLGGLYLKRPTLTPCGQWGMTSTEPVSCPHWGRDRFHASSPANPHEGVHSNTYRSKVHIFLKCTYLLPSLTSGRCNDFVTNQRHMIQRSVHWRWGEEVEDDGRVGLGLGCTEIRVARVCSYLSHEVALESDIWLIVRDSSQCRD